jgi:hypothetical protein
MSMETKFSGCPLPFCRKIASTRAFFGAATPFHFPRRRNPINCTLARGRNGLFAPLEVLGISWRAASKRWTCAIQCEFARLNFSTSASSSRRRGIFDSRAKYTFMRARLPRPSDPQSQLGKMPALCGNLFEMSVEGTKHEAYFK